MVTTLTGRNERLRGIEAGADDLLPNPDRLRGDHIPLLAQMVGIVDTFEPLTTPRPYQQAVPVDEAFYVLRQYVRRGWRQGALVHTLASVIDRLHSP